MSLFERTARLPEPHLSESKGAWVPSTRVLEGAVKSAMQAAAKSAPISAQRPQDELISALNAVIKEAEALRRAANKENDRAWRESISPMNRRH